MCYPSGSVCSCMSQPDSDTRQTAGQQDFFAMVGLEICLYSLFFVFGVGIFVIKRVPIMTDIGVSIKEREKEREGSARDFDCWEHDTTLYCLRYLATVRDSERKVGCSEERELMISTRLRRRKNNTP